MMTYPVSAAPLGDVQRRIGGRDQCVRTVAMHRPGRDPDADGRAQRRAGIDIERLRLHAGAQALGDVGGGVEIGLRQDDGDLLAAVAAYTVDGAHLLIQQLAQPLENSISRLMSMRVVDALEVVDVEQQQRDGALGALRARASSSWSST